MIETLFATFILVAGFLTLAHAFSYGVQTGDMVQKQTSAVALLTTKLEELKSGNDVPPGSYTESLEPGTLRVWRITDEWPRRITVIVYTRQGHGTFRETARLSTLVAQGF